jgi:hypothetical protein
MAKTNLPSGFTDFQNRLRHVETESKERDEKLEHEIQQIEDKYMELREDLMYMKKNLEELMMEVKSSFKNFHSSLENLREETVGSFKQFRDEMKGLHDDTVKGNEKISTKLEKVEEVSRKGLQKVSSGVAIIDILKALTDADQTTTSIERSLKEIDNRCAQAKSAVEKKRDEFDKHFEQIRQGFNKQVHIIGHHIGDLEGLFPILDELQVNENASHKYNTVIREVQNEVTAHRTRVLNRESQKIDFSRLGRFQELRERLDRFLSDPTALRFEEPPTPGMAEPLIPLGIPVDAVLLVRNEYLPQGEDDLRVYCLNAEGKDCYAKPEPGIGFSSLTKSIRAVCSRLKLENGVDLSREEVEGIKSGLRKLVDRGMLREEHLDLIEQHLDLYPLRWMES